MSLDSLFIDRRARRYIRESITSAKDVGRGKCDMCGEEDVLKHVFKKNLCDKCRKKILARLVLYSNIFCSAQPSDAEVLDLLKGEDEDYEEISEGTLRLMQPKRVDEGYFYVDIARLEADAKNKFGGSIIKLMNSYGFKPQLDWYDHYNRGQVFIDGKKIKVGTQGVRANQFLIDYGAFLVSASGSGLDPDFDGTEAQLTIASKSDISRFAAAGAASPWGIAALNIKSGKVSDIDLNAPGATAPVPPAAQPGTSNSVPAQPQLPTPAAKPVVNAQSVSNAPASGKVKAKVSGTDITKFEINLSAAYKLVCELKSAPGTTTKDYQLTFMSASGGKSFDMGNLTVNAKDDIAEIAGKILEMIIEKPSLAIPAFYETDPAGAEKFFEVDKYAGFSKFMFDELSFGSKDVSMLLCDANGKPSKSRITLSGKALLSRAYLNKELETYQESRLRQYYPVLFDGNNVVKTSIGKARFEFDKTSGNNWVISADIGATTVSFEIDPKALMSLANSVEYLKGKLLEKFDKIIPGFDRGSGSSINTTQKYKGSSVPNGELIAEFDENEFLSSGDIVFACKISVAGRDYPVPPVSFVYRKAGENLQKFLDKIAAKLYLEGFGSRTQDALKPTATQKMKTPSKKQALFSRASDEFVKRYKGKIPELEDLDVEVEFSVDQMGQVTSGQIKVTDTYGDFSDSKELLANLRLDKFASFLKAGKPSTNKRETSVTYIADDLEEFYKGLNLQILEHMIFEAFGLTRITESGMRSRAGSSRIVIRA